ncbi:MAG TPA: glucosamine-6-phosphate deaminase [Mycobacteriales bacterium]|nr:glucosamine-6-phosphate deaminase [Mycobacteriales bacterium]
MIETTRYDDLEVRIAGDLDELAHDAADVASATIREAIAQRGEATVILATGNSQLVFLAELTARSDIPWQRVRVLHMDEYVGIGREHPASFARYIQERVVEVVQPMEAYLINGTGPVADEIEHYTALLHDHPVDLTCLGIGENGHLAFNDPPVADFDDPLDVKEVEMDLACRRQQVGEGHFPTVNDVPRTAITLTIPALLRARRVIGVVPNERKAGAVCEALVGPIDTHCPASILRRTAHATVWLDPGSASLLPPRAVA